MLFTTSAPLLFSAAFLSTTSLAAPTRTNCQCTIVSDAPSPPIDTPSTAHWLPSDPSPSSAAADPCSPLGPKLDRIRHTQPDIFKAYLHQTNTKRYCDDIPQAIPNPAVLAYTAPRHTPNDNNDIDNTTQDVPHPLERIVCRSSQHQSDSTHQPSFFHLWTSQIIITAVILACIAEGLHTALQWFTRRTKNNDDDDDDNTASESYPGNTTSYSSRLRLLGGEKLLLAIPPLADTASLGAMASPGAEKKSRAYEVMSGGGGGGRVMVAQARSCGRWEVVAYDGEDDDEAGRPVM